MEYRTFNGEKVSRLGMGNMRLPVLPGKPDKDIDYDKAAAIIDYGMSNGITYYDTAYVYHSGASESFLGDALVKRYPRDSFTIATKFNIRANPDYKAVFAEQLERLKTDYIDFYLIHALGDDKMREYIDSGSVAYFEEQKRLGKIRYFGFSSHASPETLAKFADYRKWDFAQIQMNYYDWLFGSAEKEYNILDERQIPIVVMEPVRGGRLAALTNETEALLKAAHPEWSVPSWALRWVKAHPRVMTVLSGMSALSQIEDNVKTFSDGYEMTTGDMELCEKVCGMFKNQVVVPCTSCRYCVDGCPSGIIIPEFLKVYNNYKLQGEWALHDAKNIESKGIPRDCVECGACIGQCPQGIKVPEFMKELAKAMEK